MRGEVDELQTELNIRREEHKNRMAFLTAQLAELEANRDRESLRVRQLQEDLDLIKQEVTAAGDTSEAMAPVVLAVIDRVRQHVENGIPFKNGERLEALQDIEAQLSGGILTSQRAVNRLWAFLEDELRMTKENAIYTQSVNIGGRSVLVDIAKLGTAMMYFRTRDLRYGRATGTPGDWRFEYFDSSADEERVAMLFDSLRKQIRQGYFELPYAIPPSGSVVGGGSK
jgi:hypothetical protein